MNKELTIEELSTFAKKKGFAYQSSEIYGGLSGVYDYGHVGALLKQHWQNEWKKFFLKLHDNFVEIESSIIMPENVFKASGHLENFFDPIIHVEGSEQTFRADHVIEDALGIRAEELSNEEMLKKIKEGKLLGEKIDHEKISIENLNLMFPVSMGPKLGTKAYLRPETAQSPFVNFKTQFELQRKKLPLGLALIGRVYRNEISPRNMLLRTRELEQAELQIFFNSSKIGKHEDFESVKNQEILILFSNVREKGIKKLPCYELLNRGLPEFYVYHLAKIQDFFLNVMKVPEENFRFYELNDDEKAFYNKFHFDIEVNMHSTNSWVEVGGLHYRTDHDLVGHQNVSKVKMEIFDEESQEKCIPHVLELSFGVGRSFFTLLDQHYDYDEERKNTVLRLPQKLAPYLVAVFPLMNKEELTTPARALFEELREEDLSCVYDVSGSIGKRYFRQDEVGTPYCLTLDYESVEEGEMKGTITLRERDSGEQKRIKINECVQILKDLIRGKRRFGDL